MLKGNKKYKFKILRNFMLIGCSLLFLSHANAKTQQKGNGELHIYGMILEEPCRVLNEDIIVDFGIMTNKDLFRGNNEYRKFSIELKCDVEVNKAVNLQFNGMNTSENNQLLDLAASSQASGVGIKIQDALGSILTFGTPTKLVDVSAGIHHLEFTAFVTKKADTFALNDISLGNFEAFATFQIQYE